MKNKTIIFFTVILLSTMNLLGQISVFVFPSAKNISYKLNCSISLSGGFYEYSYQIKTYPASQQRIYSVMIESFSEIQQVNSPLGWNGKEYTLFKKKVGWYTSDSTKRIGSGETKSGFNFQSSGLPIIGISYCRGYVPQPVVTVEPDSIVGDNIFENSVKMKTIVPRSIPTSFSFNSFVEELISMGNEADTLGWIGEKDLANNHKSKISIEWLKLKTSLKKVLVHFKDECYDDDNKELHKFLTVCTDYYNQPIDFQKLTSESYALFYFNGMYLKNYVAELIEYQ